jgi:hypothetical protein
VGDAVGVNVAVLVAVAVFVGVAVEVAVNVLVGVGDAVGVLVAVAVDVAVLVAVGVAPEHNATLEAMFRGTGAVITSKSRLLLSVSVHPPVFLTPPRVEFIAEPLFTDEPPSPLPAVPFPAAP